MSGNLADVSVGLESMLGSALGFFGLIISVYGVVSLVILFLGAHDSDDYGPHIFKSMISLIFGGTLVGNTFNADTLVLFKYLGIFVGAIIILAILAAICMFIFNILQYKKYIKITNELLLLSDDFLVLSSNLQTIDDQIVLNSKMADTVNGKKKEEITFLNSLLTKKRVRFDGIIADVRATVSL